MDRASMADFYMEAYASTADKSGSGTPLDTQKSATT
jgi:hypothetical protein